MSAPAPAPAPLFDACARNAKGEWRRHKTGMTLHEAASYQRAAARRGWDMRIVSHRAVLPAPLPSPVIGRPGGAASAIDSTEAGPCA